MEYQQKIVLLVAVLLVALAVYFILSDVERVEAPADTAEAKELLMQGIEFGKGHDNYFYSFTEDTNEYTTSYSLTKNEDEMMVKVINPLATKRVFFLSNDTVLCIAYPEEEICSSVKDESRLENYLYSLEVKFFNDDLIAKNVMDMEYLLSKDYVDLNPEVTEKTVKGFKCKEVSYSIDFSNLSLNEAARFGISSNSPKHFARSMCINNESGYKVEETLQYTYQGMMQTWTSQLISFQPGAAGEIVAPDNLTEGAVDILYKERQQQADLATCFTTMEGEDKERCVSTLALNSRRMDLCDLAGERRDRCLVSLMPVTHDEAICSAVQDPSYKDDCYIELAGGLKNSTYCLKVEDASKLAYCQEVAEPVPEEEPEEPEEENESDDGGVNITDFLDYIDRYDEDEPEMNETNATE